MTKEKIWRITCDECKRTKIVDTILWNNFTKEIEDQDFCDECYYRKRILEGKYE